MEGDQGAQPARPGGAHSAHSHEIGPSQLHGATIPAPKLAAHALAKFLGFFLPRQVFCSRNLQPTNRRLLHVLIQWPDWDVIHPAENFTIRQRGAGEDYRFIDTQMFR